jgi:HEAT repeat protein
MLGLIRQYQNIGEELAKGLSNATIQHSNDHNFEKMEIHLDELRELNLTVKDKSLREELAKGLFSAINNSVKVHNFGKMELFFHELHKMHMNFKDKNVRLLVADTLRIVFPHVSDTKLAWDDLHRFTLDKDNDVRRSAVNTLGIAFSFVLNKEQAWEDLQRLTSDNNSSVRERAANALGIAFSQVPDKKKARNDLHRLTSDNDKDVRGSAADALGTAYSYIPEEYKKQSWDDLRRLTQDKDKDVRIAANYSSGRVSIFMASQANSDEKLRKELETAIGFFENVSSEATNFNPAKFCLPFYRSFYTIVFRKKEAEAEVIQYLAQAKGAVEGSKNKGKLLEAIENLGNALIEAHKAQEVQDFDAMKSDLNAYRRYCNRAFELLNTTEEKSPSASSLIRKGLPIIDERIKGIIAEIREKAKAACQQSRGTLTEELALTANTSCSYISPIMETKQYNLDCY